MAKELIDYIREIRQVAGSQVGVHFGEKSPYHIREILRICEAAEQQLQSYLAAAGICPLCSDKLFCAMCGEHVAYPPNR